MGSDTPSKLRPGARAGWTPGRLAVAAAAVLLLFALTRPPAPGSAVGTPPAGVAVQSATDRAAAGGEGVGADDGAAVATSPRPAPPARGLYRFTVTDIDGAATPLSRYAGRVTLLVNVASACGYTASNYAGLQVLYDELRHTGFSVLAFPCNCFSQQEPGSDAEIKAFALASGATFPLFGARGRASCARTAAAGILLTHTPINPCSSFPWRSAAKVPEVNGPTAAPVFQWLHAQPGGEAPVSWNFDKACRRRERACAPLPASVCRCHLSAARAPSYWRGTGGRARAPLALTPNASPVPSFVPLPAHTLGRCHSSWSLVRATC